MGAPESRLRELRHVRHRLHEIAEEARENGDLRLELDVHRELNRTLTLDEKLSEKLQRDPEKRRMDELVDSLTY